MNEPKKESKLVTIKTIELIGDKPNVMVQESLYKTHPMLNLAYLGGGYPTVLKMGVGKVKMALWYVDDLKAFLDKHGDKLANSPE